MSPSDASHDIFQVTFYYELAFHDWHERTGGSDAAFQRTPDYQEAYQDWIESGKYNG